MIPTNGRTRIVSFRIQEAEYQRLVELSARNGYTSPGEAARSVIHEFIDVTEKGSEIPLSVRLTGFDGRLNQMSREIRRISRTLKGVRAKISVKESSPA